jgi:metal-responsive CopG/Arc/MetJ family transcriptional regulator
MIIYHTKDKEMTKVKVAITIDEELLRRVDHLVANGKFRNRSNALENAVKDNLDRIEQTRLAQECNQLIPSDEQAIAEEGLEGDLTEWQEY